MLALPRNAYLAGVVLSFAAIAGCSTSPGDDGGITDATAAVAVDAGPDADGAPHVEASSDGPIEAGCTSSSCGAGFVCVNGGCEGTCDGMLGCPLDAGRFCHNGGCIQCLGDSQCPAATPWCDPVGVCGVLCQGWSCPPYCRTDSDCAPLDDAGGDTGTDAAADGGAYVCNMVTHQCVHE